MFQVKNNRTGRVLEISVNDKPWDFTKDPTDFSDAKPKTWLYVDSRIRFDSFKLNRMRNSPVRIIDPIGYRRETKESWSFGR